MSTSPHESLTPTPRRRRWPVVLLCVVLFLLGGITGAGLTAIFAIREARFVIRHPEVVPARATARLRRALDLSDDQAAQIQQILQKRQANLQGIRRDVEPRVNAELDALRSEIAAVLNPLQAKKWHRLFDDKRAAWMPPAATATAQAG